MFSLIKGLFSNDTNEAATSLVDNISNAADKLVLTKEEKVEFKQKGFELWIKMQEALGDANSARAKARRFLAISTTLTTLGTFVITLLHVFIGFWFDIDVKPLVADVIKLATAFMLGELTIAVFIFYFGKGIVDKLKAGAK